MFTSRTSPAWFGVVIGEGGGVCPLKTQSLSTCFRIKNYVICNSNVLPFITVIKDGVLTRDVLEFLSMYLGSSWKPLARCLKFKEAQIVAFHKENEELREKALKMLLKWKANYGSEATYRVLFDALCNERVGEKELAERFCCFEVAMEIYILVHLCKLTTAFRKALTDSLELALMWLKELVAKGK